mmetsp:Transcript_9252/g.24439  ORF Transcript_9252/g.24439 Transcript_9252/m.24439 type:complete len:361 (-) Transcript_9252:368-1450(-)
MGAGGGGRARRVFIYELERGPGPGVPMGEVRYAIDRAESAKCAYAANWRGVQMLLAEQEERALSTTLLIVPSFCHASADGFDAFSATLTFALTSFALEKELQLVFFHPRYCFCDGATRFGAESAAEAGAVNEEQEYDAANPSHCCGCSSTSAFASQPSSDGSAYSVDMAFFCNVDKSSKTEIRALQNSIHPVGSICRRRSCDSAAQLSPRKPETQSEVFCWLQALVHRARRRICYERSRGSNPHASQHQRRALRQIALEPLSSSLSQQIPQLLNCAFFSLSRATAQLFRHQLRFASHLGNAFHAQRLHLSNPSKVEFLMERTLRGRCQAQESCARALAQKDRLSPALPRSVSLKTISSHP